MIPINLNPLQGIDIGNVGSINFGQSKLRGSQKDRSNRELLTENNAGEIDDTDADHCYAFVNISVGIWREMSEKDVEDLLMSARFY